MKTIKQIADELKVSKQAVYKRYKGKLYTEVYPYIHTENGTVYIKEQGETIIKQDFLKDQAHTDHIQYTHTEHIQGYTGVHTEYTPDTQLFDTLNKTIELLQEQLKVKDKQIEELHNIINGSQQLQAGTIQRLTEPKEETTGADAELIPEPEQEPKKWYQFFRKKGKSSN